MAPRNRKGRRPAAEKDTTKSSTPETESSIPLAHPSEDVRLSNRDMKSLYEIAAERQTASPDDSAPASSSTQRGKTPELIQFSPSGGLQSAPGSTSDAAAAGSGNDTAVADDDGDDDDDDDENDDAAPIPPLPDTILFSLPLSVLHGTLSFVAAHLYLQQIPIAKLVRDSIFIAFPALTFLIHLSHGHIISFDALLPVWNSKDARRQGKRSQPADEEPDPASMRALFRPTPRNFVYLLVSMLLGAQLISISNDAAYYAVMKKAPPVGTLWVWCALEMSPGFAALGLLLPMGWAVLWKGYGVI